MVTALLEPPSSGPRSVLAARGQGSVSHDLPSIVDGARGSGEATQGLEPDHSCRALPEKCATPVGGSRKAALADDLTERIHCQRTALPGAQCAEVDHFTALPEESV